MVDAVNAFVFDGRMSCPAFAFDKSGQAALRIGLADAFSIAIMPGLSLWPFPSRNDDDIGFGRQNFQGLSVPSFLRKARRYLPPASNRQSRPHTFAEGVAVFGRALVAELDIDFRFGLLGARDTFLDIGNASGGVFSGNFLGARLRTVEFAENFPHCACASDGFGVEIDHDDGYACRFNARQMGGDGLILPVGPRSNTSGRRERFLQ